MLKHWKILVLTAFILVVTSCDSKDGNTITEVEVPTNYQLTLYGENEGIHPNTNVLEDPENPYADANINMENIWELTEECPSAKAKFYLWATILANIPIGEYQYFTATALHELYTVGGSINAKEQAKKAYRAVLDHFFGSVTWWEAEWLNEETYYAVLVRNLAGKMLYDPADENLLPLYSDPAMALADLSEWGYVYDIETGTITKIQQ